MGLSTRQPSNLVSLTSESSLTDGLAVVVGSADMTCALPGGADPTGGVLGVVFRPDGSTAASGAVVDVVTDGIYPCVASAAITRGAKVAIAGASGKVKTAAPSAGTNTMILGTALESAAADGERIAVLLQTSLMQG
jgi:hypothetical protein